MRGATVVIGLVIAAGMAVAAEPAATQAAGSQAPNEIIVLSVAGMT